MTSKAPEAIKIGYETNEKSTFLVENLLDHLLAYLIVFNVRSSTNHNLLISLGTPESSISVHRRMCDLRCDCRNIYNLVDLDDDVQPINGRMVSPLFCSTKTLRPLLAEDKFRKKKGEREREPKHQHVFLFAEDQKTGTTHTHGEIRKERKKKLLTLLRLQFFQRLHTEQLSFSTFVYFCSRITSSSSLPISVLLIDCLINYIQKVRLLKISSIPQTNVRN